MARARKDAVTDLQAAQDKLTAAQVEYRLHEYGHAFVDITYTDEDGVKQLLEFRPDGSAIERDHAGKEVV